MNVSFAGLSVALATPFHANGEVDLLAFRRLVRHVAGGGADGLVVLGSTGEAATILDDERDALVAIKQNGTDRILVGLVMEDRGVPRHGHEVQAKGQTIGVVTSGTFSPTLEQSIALAYVKRDENKYSSIGTELDVVIRGKPCKARVCKTPFHRGSVRS